MSARRVERCGVCGERRLEMMLSLGSSPPPCVMHPIGRRPVVEEHYPLELLRCRSCGLVQLSVVVDPEVMFAPDFPYSSGNSKQLHKTFEDLAGAAKDFLAPDDLVVDIGANDGTLLSKFDCRTVGVEPTNQADRIEGPAYKAFFDDPDLADEIYAAHGLAKVVTACNVMAHVEDPNAVMRCVRRLLAPDGWLIVDNHDLSAVLAGQWDMVYHEHLRFYSPQTFARLLGRHALGCAAWHPIDTHGGSFRMFARADALGAQHRYPSPGTWDYYPERVSRVRAHIRALIAGRPIWGIGATARGTTILNYCGLDAEDVECVLEQRSSDKLGHYVPGTSIPVVDESRLFDEDAPRALLLSWHMKDIIVPKLRAKGYQKPILVPLPEPHYV